MLQRKIIASACPDRHLPFRLTLTNLASHGPRGNFPGAPMVSTEFLLTIVLPSEGVWDEKQFAGTIESRWLIMIWQVLKSGFQNVVATRKRVVYHILIIKPASDDYVETCSGIMIFFCPQSGSFFLLIPSNTFLGDGPCRYRPEIFFDRHSGMNSVRRKRRQKESWTYYGNAMCNRPKRHTVLLFALRTVTSSTKWDRWKHCALIILPKKSPAIPLFRFHFLCSDLQLHVFRNAHLRDLIVTNDERAWRPTLNKQFMKSYVVPRNSLASATNHRWPRWLIL